VFAIFEDCSPLTHLVQKTLVISILLEVCLSHLSTNPSLLQPTRTPPLHHPCHHPAPLAQRCNNAELLPDYGPAAKVCPLVATLSHTVCHTASGRRGYMGLYFVPGRSSEHSFSHNGYITWSPTGLSPANRRMCKLEEGEVEGKGCGRGLLVDTPVLEQSPTLEPP